MTTQTPSVTDFLDTLNNDYVAIHIAKEDAFWTAYMGLSDDPDAARADFNTKEIALQNFLRDPQRLKDVRAVLEQARANGSANEEELIALEGWEATFAANTIELIEAHQLADETVEAESELAKARGGMKLGYQVPGEEFVEASSVKVAVMINTDPDPARRKAAWEGLRSIETFVLENGFLEILKMRNRLGRMLGAEDYYEWKVQRTEGMSKKDIFNLLGELEAKTRESAMQFIEDLKAEKGPEAATPWSIRYATRGDVVTEQDPYFPFSKSFERWGKSFNALKIDYRDAELVLDLVDRKGKYENGFMHGPEPAWRKHGEFQRARIQFTANAIPGMVGSGNRAINTLFHEGGHAAHFANIDMPAPCFAQEFAPTSVAFAETQSMFLDSLINDADWMSRYAKTVAGQAMPIDLIEKGIRSTQPGAAWEIRAMLVVPFAEKALYELQDDEITAERVLQIIRDTEKKLLFLEEGSPRPVLSVPHLLAGEASAYYHGYVMAEMAVHQTRNYFLDRDGHLVDNPKIGPDLRDAYWRPGNSRRFFDFIESLTGTPLSADHLARHVNRSADEAIAGARKQIQKLGSIPQPQGEVRLDASIKVMHGNELVADTAEGGFDSAAAKFEAWIDRQAAANA